MGMPTTITYNGTTVATSSIWFADWMQAPFSVTFAAIANSTASYNIEYTLDNIDISGPGGGSGAVGLGIGTTLANATWFQSTVSGTTISASGNIGSPVRAMRCNIVTAAAIGSSVTVTFIQATR